MHNLRLNWYTVQFRVNFLEYCAGFLAPQASFDSFIYVRYDFAPPISLHYTIDDFISAHVSSQGNRFVTVTRSSVTSQYNVKLVLAILNHPKEANFCNHKNKQSQSRNTTAIGTNIYLLWEVGGQEVTSTHSQDASPPPKHPPLPKHPHHHPIFPPGISADSHNEPTVLTLTVKL